LANFKKQGVFQQNRDLSFGKLGLNSRQVLTQFWVCLHAPLEPGDRFADHRIIQVANQPAQFSKTQPPSGPPEPERRIATPVAVPLGELVPALPFGPLQRGYNLLPTGSVKKNRVTRNN
jgi:hypothetical protein